MTRSFLASLAACVLLSSHALGGVLSFHPSALPGFTGSVSVTASGGSAALDADLDFAVFTAAAFNANFGGLGYTPDGPLVYTYQLTNNAGSVPLTTEIVGIANAASNIGTFNIGDVDADDSMFGGLGATWTFPFPPGVQPGETTYGLAFSSTNLPAFGTSLTVSLTDVGALSAILSGVVPTPGDTAIPEPTAALLVFAGVVVVASRRRAA